MIHSSFSTNGLKKTGGMRLAVLLALIGVVTPARAQSNSELLELQAKAYQADANAQNALGNAYSNGSMGLKQDLVEALRWYGRAAEQGLPQALFNIGLAYELGRGVPVNVSLAFQYYREAAEAGYSIAQFNVGNMYATGRGVAADAFEAVLWYRQAAEQGLAEAQFNLGLAYETGRGVLKDDQLAAQWYRAAAAQDFALAQYNLALFFEDGRGVTQDQATASTLYRAAAEKGVPEAQNNYGLMLMEGRIGPKDPVEGFVWLSLAVENGISPAARDILASQLTPMQKAEAEARLQNRRKAGKAGTASDGGQVNQQGNITELQEQMETLRAKNSELGKWVESLELALSEKPREDSTPILERFGLEPRILTRNDELIQEISRLKEELELARNQTKDAHEALRKLRLEYDRRPIPDDESTAIVKLRSELLGAQYQNRELETKNIHLERWVQLLEQHLAQQNASMAALRESAASSAPKQP